MSQHRSPVPTFQSSQSPAQGGRTQGGARRGQNVKASFVAHMSPVRGQSPQRQRQQQQQQQMKSSDPKFGYSPFKSPSRPDASLLLGRQSGGGVHSSGQKSVAIGAGATGGSSSNSNGNTSTSSGGGGGTGAADESPSKSNRRLWDDSKAVGSYARIPRSNKATRTSNGESGRTMDDARATDAQHFLS